MDAQTNGHSITADDVHNDRNSWNSNSNKSKDKNMNLNMRNGNGVEGGQSGDGSSDDDALNLLKDLYDFSEDSHSSNGGDNDDDDDDEEIVVTTVVKRAKKPRKVRRKVTIGTRNIGGSKRMQPRFISRNGTTNTGSNKIKRSRKLNKMKNSTK